MKDQIAALLTNGDKLAQLAVGWAPKLAGALFVLTIGLWIVKLLMKGLRKMLSKRKLDPSLTSFLISFSGTVFRVLVIISVMGMIGIQMTSFIALLGAAGLAIGMALSGTLQNFAGGVILLIFRPFNVGDFIQAQGHSGIVREITIFTTILTTVDNKIIILPNGHLATNDLTNYTKEDTRRVDWKFGMTYVDDMDNFKKAINDFINEDSRIFKDPKPFIGLIELGDSSVNFAVRVWAKTSDYWDIFFEMNEKVYKRFPDYQLHIPFPQVDVHLHQQ